jgi:hypothetical protein
MNVRISLKYKYFNEAGELIAVANAANHKNCTIDDAKRIKEAWGGAESRLRKKRRKKAQRRKPNARDWRNLNAINAAVRAGRPRSAWREFLDT